jgi:hypothetical protein
MKPLTRTQRTKGITRIEIPEKHTFGWMMRIRRGKKSFQEWFADKRFGGKSKAKVAALKRYQRLAAKLPTTTLSSKGRKTKRNSSGKVGVYLKKSTGNHAKGEYYAYVAFWLNPRGQKESVSFALEKYGHTKAWKMACHAREHETANKKAIESRFGFHRDN